LKRIKEKTLNLRTIITIEIKKFNNDKKRYKLAEKKKSMKFKIDQLGLSSLRNRRSQWHPTPVVLPGKSHGCRILVGCSPWGR